jgi:hypothetical protein
MSRLDPVTNDCGSFLAKGIGCTREKDRMTRRESHGPQNIPFDLCPLHVIARIQIPNQQLFVFTKTEANCKLIILYLKSLKTNNAPRRKEDIRTNNLHDATGGNYSPRSWSCLQPGVGYEVLRRLIQRSRHLTLIQH